MHWRGEGDPYKTYVRALIQTNLGDGAHDLFVKSMLQAVIPCLLMSGEPGRFPFVEILEAALPRKHSRWTVRVMPRTLGERSSFEVPL